MRKLLILGALLMNGLGLTAQMGCTDPLATNYDENAVENDGSCLYASTIISIDPIANFVSGLSETSGLQWINGKLYTHIDQDEDKIYEINASTAAIESNSKLAGADNVDWEDIAASDTHTFIGDFGNNGGNRTDLTIYKVGNATLGDAVINSEVIEFSYEDQTDFTLGDNETNYDCEAFVFYNDSLHLFTKNWLNFKTKHYVIPATAGTHIAELRGTFDALGLITAADINAEGQTVLLGYTLTGNTFMWLFWDFEGSNFFGGNKRRIQLGSAIDNGQIEGVAFQSNGAGFISAESFLNIPARLFTFDVSQYLEPVSTQDLSQLINAKVFPNPFNEQITLKSGSVAMESVRIYNGVGQLVYSTSLLANAQTQFSTAHWQSGLYMMHIETREGLFFQKIVKL